MKIINLFVLFLFLFFNICFSGELKPIECKIREFDICKVKRVIDGDTYELTCLNRNPSIIKLRLKDIDVFESYNNAHLKKQLNKTNYTKEEIIKFGIIVKNDLKRNFENKFVILVLDDYRKDFYKRYLGEIYFLSKDQTKLISLKNYIETKFKDYIHKK